MWKNLNVFNKFKKRPRPIGKPIQLNVGELRLGCLVHRCNVSGVYVVKKIIDSKSVQLCDVIHFYLQYPPVNLVDIEKLTRIDSVGSYIELINNGACYTTYSDMATKLGLTNWDEAKTPEAPEAYKIIACDFETGPNNFYAIESKDGKQYIIDQSGFIKDE